MIKQHTACFIVNIHHCTAKQLSIAYLAFFIFNFFLFLIKTTFINDSFTSVYTNGHLCGVMTLYNISSEWDAFEWCICNKTCVGWLIETYEFIISLCNI